MTPSIQHEPIISHERIKSEIRAMPIAQLRALRRGTIRSCCNCDLFNISTEVCKIAGSRPPALVIVLGCDSWIEEIPF